MDDLSEQLRSYGQATEQHIEPVQAHHVSGDGTARDIEVATQRPVASQVIASHRRRWVLAAAASVLLIAVASAVFVGRDDRPAALDTASSGTISLLQDGEIPRFNVPNDDNGWEAVRFCESTSTYDIDTGNTFYGAYQFTREVWRLFASSLGLDNYGTMNPADAPPEIQDAIANAIYLERGDQPWPICGRHFDGPQVTPVVPQWIGHLDRGSFPVTVFLSSSLSDDRVEAIRAELIDILPRRVEETMTFVDKAEAFEEFQAMFQGGEHIRESVKVEDMPVSIRIGTELTAITLQRIRDITGVLEVVIANDDLSLNPPPPMKLFIPALDLAVPVYGTATTENLAAGPAVFAGNGLMPYIGGYGSVEGAVFARLDELRDGDLIEVSTLLGSVDHRMLGEVVRTYEVSLGDGAAEPEPEALEDLPPWAELTDRGLTLVADVPGDATKRLVIRTRLVMPDPLSYGIIPA